MRTTHSSSEKALAVRVGVSLLTLLPLSLLSSPSRKQLCLSLTGLVRDGCLPPESSPENLMPGNGSAGPRLQAGPDMQVVMGDDHWSEKFSFSK